MAPLREVHLVRDGLTVRAVGRRGRAVRQNHDSVEPNRGAEGARHRLEQRKIRRVRARGLVHSVKVQHDVRLVFAREPLRVRHDLRVVLDVRARGLQTRRVDEPKCHAAHLVGHHARLLRLRPKRIRRGGALAQERVDRGALAHAGLAEQENRAREPQIARGALPPLRGLRKRHGAVKGGGRPATAGACLLGAALELLGELKPVNHLRHHVFGVARAASRCAAGSRADSGAWREHGVLIEGSGGGSARQAPRARRRRDVGDAARARGARAPRRSPSPPSPVASALTGLAPPV